jgi:hypothetical protein
MKEQVNDAVHINIAYGAETPDGNISYFSSFPAVKAFARETGIKHFFAFDKENRNNIIKIMTIYMDRYREDDIEDRLIANKQQGGKSSFVKTYKDERKKEDNNGQVL